MTKAALRKHSSPATVGPPIMRLWTIQTEEAWTRAKRRGVLVGDGRYVFPDWRPAYRWMAGAMRRRLPAAPSRAVAPVWAWLRWTGNSTRPDLRTPGHVRAGTRAVRLEFLTRADDILCSDFQAWHFVLNYWYLPKNQADGRRFDARLRRRGLDFYRTKPLREGWAHDAVERSWDRIFTIRGSATSVQACLWEVPVSAVTDVTVFTGRSAGAI